jgi:signal transduction histidine kinase
MTTLFLVISWIAAAVAIIMALVIFRSYKTLQADCVELERRNQERDLLRDQEHQSQLQRLREQSSKDQKTKTTFIASAAHDLRQPLHALSLFSDALLNQNLDADTQDIATKIKRSVTALVELFNTLFDVSKLETGSKEAKIRDFPLQQLLQVVDAEYAAQAHAKGLQWQCDPVRYSVRSDPALLETILRNLISNAMRYTQQGSISLNTSRENGLVRISVSDTGVGIPKPQQEDIFQEFHQLGTTSRATTTGLGLGLSIVERLIKLLDHRIEVQSEVGQGTTFTLIVAEGAELAAPAAQPEAPVVNDLAGLQVLVIDDDPQVRDSMQSLLQSWQCQVTLAGTEQQVRELLLDKRISPQVIISDYRLAKHVDGLRLLTSILPRINLRVPVLFVSGDTSGEVVEKVRTQGYWFLPKPVAPAQLRAFLRNAARQKTAPPAGTTGPKRPQLNEFPLQSLLNRFVGDYHAQAEEKGVVFNYGCDSLMVNSNAELLETIVRNLLNFAFKRTSKGSVTLNCKAHLDGAHIEISDSGKALSPQTRTLLRQYQVDPKTTEDTGLNLGLSLAFKLAHSLGHQIQVSDPDSAGLTFQVLIPPLASETS